MYLRNDHAKCRKKAGEGKKKTPCLFYESTWRIQWVFCICIHFLFFSSRVTVCTRNNGTDSFRTLISSVPACALHRYYLTFIKQCLISPQRRDASCANAHLLPFIRFDSFFSLPDCAFLIVLVLYYPSHSFIRTLSHSFAQLLI